MSSSRSIRMSSTCGVSAAVPAFGAVGERITDPGDLGEALEAGTAADTPHVLDVRIDREEDMADQLASSFYESVGGLHE